MTPIQAAPEPVAVNSDGGLTTPSPNGYRDPFVDLRIGGVQIVVVLPERLHLLAASTLMTVGGAVLGYFANR